MTVYFGGEDVVTSEIAKKLISYCYPASGIPYQLEDVLLRKNGEAALSSIDSCVSLGNTYPVVCVFDSDGRCLVNLLGSHSQNGWKSRYCSINLAYDEGENWLVSDTDGFARYFDIPIQYVPVKRVGDAEVSDSLRIKPSMFLLNEVFNRSNNPNIQSTMYIKKPFNKPATYNNYWPDYIQNHWNIETAATNSESLQRAINRTMRIFN